MSKVGKKVEIGSSYVEDYDVTVVERAVYEGDEITEYERVGFYFGKPDESKTQASIGTTVQVRGRGEITHEEYVKAFADSIDMTLVFVERYAGDTLVEVELVSFYMGKAPEESAEKWVKQYPGLKHKL